MSLKLLKSLPMVENGKWLGMAKLTPTNRTKPAISETQMDLTMPLGPLMAALIVSSVMCADASYPVYVY